jgi:DNA-binding NarL/FixJ family response regulator
MTIAPKLRVLLADDDPIVIRGVARLLGLREDFEVVGVANDGRTAVQLALGLAPDLVLMDLQMPGGMSGLDAARAITTTNEKIRILLLTGVEDPRIEQQARAAGAAGCVRKNMSFPDLVEAMRRATA